MQRYLLATCLLLAASADAALAVQTAQDAPPAVLEMPGPEDATFRFRPVRVGGGAGPLAGQYFKLGDASGGFRTPPTAVVLGGPFASDESRFFYMGECEVTREQYHAVMGRDAGPPPKEDEGSLPVANISYFDAVSFTDRLNRWLYANAMDRLPGTGGYPAFVRLPTEEEWEFAARGGTGVPGTVFDAATPYGEGNLAEYEWFAGEKSSHNRPRPAGRLKPNPLGLHDMLGNVQEMTMSLYRLEYYQGRSGGFVSRGGDYLTPEAGMASSRRFEQPFYLGGVGSAAKPNAKPTLGFRLVLAAPVFGNRQERKEREEAWKKATRFGPAGDSVNSISSQMKVPMNEILMRLNRISDALEGTGYSAAVKQEAANMESALRDIERIRRKADEDSAFVWSRIAGERGMFLHRNLRNLQDALDAERGIAAGRGDARDRTLAMMQKRIREFSWNVDAGLDSYGEIMAELVRLPKDAVLKGFKENGRRLRERIEREKSARTGDSAAAARDLDRQLGMLAVTRRHYEQYEREKRSNAAGWRSDYSRNGADEGGKP